MGKIVEGVLMDLVAPVKVTQEIVEILLFKLKVLEKPHIAEDLLNEGL